MVKISLPRYTDVYVILLLIVKRHGWMRRRWVSLCLLCSMYAHWRMCRCSCSRFWEWERERVGLKELFCIDWSWKWKCYPVYEISYTEDLSWSFMECDYIYRSVLLFCDYYNYTNLLLYSYLGFQGAIALECRHMHGRWQVQKI